MCFLPVRFRADLMGGAVQTRTLYSLRHTYATLALLDGGKFKLAINYRRPAIIN